MPDSKVYDRLCAICDGRFTPTLPGYKGAIAFGGFWKELRVIMTQDHDGQVEISLSNHDHVRVSSKQARRFWKAFGSEPECPREDSTRSCIWVFRRGRMQ